RRNGPRGNLDVDLIVAPDLGAGRNDDQFTVAMDNDRRSGHSRIFILQTTMAPVRRQIGPAGFRKPAPSQDCKRCIDFSSGPNESSSIALAAEMNSRMGEISTLRVASRGDCEKAPPFGAGGAS